jgi:hypothetical protein
MVLALACQSGTGAMPLEIHATLLSLKRFDMSWGVKWANHRQKITPSLLGIRRNSVT